MAVVYRAVDPNIGREVALKLMAREFLANSRFYDRFIREARAIGALESSAIVPLYDFGEDKGQPYLVMRLMTGGSLMDRLYAQGAMSLEEANQLLSRLAEALDEAHAKGIIHRDLKPGNILFDQKGVPYLADFGIVKMLEHGSMTTQGAIGTPAYMSPEHFEGKITPQSDIYALGIILFQVLTGQLPFDAQTPPGWLKAHLMNTPPPLRHFNPNLPIELEPILQRALAKSAQARYATVAEMAHAFNQVVSKQLRQEQTFTTIPIITAPQFIQDVPTVPSPQRQPISNSVTTQPVWRPVLLIVALMGLGLMVIIPMGLKRESVVAFVLPTDTPKPAATWTATFTPQPALTWTPTATPVPVTDTPLSSPTVTPIIPTDTPTLVPTPTFTPTPTNIPSPSPTFTPTPIPLKIKHAALSLESPTVDQIFTNREAEIKFQWSDVSPVLAADEFYVLIITHKFGKDYIWLKANSYLLPNEKRWLADNGPELSWQVVVAQKRTVDPNEDPSGNELSDYSESHKFRWVLPGSDGGQDTDNVGSIR